MKKTRQNIIEEKRDLIFINLKESKREIKGGRMKFSSQIPELKKMLKTK